MFSKVSEILVEKKAISSMKVSSSVSPTSAWPPVRWKTLAYVETKRQGKKGVSFTSKTRPLTCGGRTCEETRSMHRMKLYLHLQLLQKLQKASICRTTSLLPVLLRRAYNTVILAFLDLHFDSLGDYRCNKGMNR